MQTPHIAHGTGLEPVEPDWPILQADEVEQLLQGYPGLAGGCRITWHSPRPFSAASLVETTGATVFVKRHATQLRSARQLAEEHRFIEHLHRAGLPVAELFHDRHGDTAVEQHGWTYEVHGVLQGQDLYRDALSWTPFLDLRHARAAGHTLARLHQASQRFQAPARQPALLNARLNVFAQPDPLSYLQRYLHRHPALADYLHPLDWQAEFQHILLPYHRPLLAHLARQPTLWTHNDWHASNLLWQEQDGQMDVCGIFDFGLCNQGFALFDLATAIERNCIPWLQLDLELPAEADLDQLDALLDGYASLLPLHSDDLSCLIALLPLVHADFALSEVEYFQGLVGSRHNADVAYQRYLLGHALWFSSPQGQRLLTHLQRRASTRA